MAIRLAGLTGATLETTPTSVAEVMRGDRRLTNVGAAFAADVTSLEPEPFTAVSPDGTEVPAWIIRPPGSSTFSLTIRPCSRKSFVIGVRG